MATNKIKKTLCVLLLGAAAQGAWAAQLAPNGISLPEGYKNWQLIAPSLRTDKNHLRAILGNEVAVRAAREDKVNPWPDGAMLAKLAWTIKTDEHWPAATVPAEFVQVEIMVKDAAKYAATGGWGFARWVGKDLKPYGKDAAFVQECFGCHTPVQDKDYVFTRLAPLP